MLEDITLYEFNSLAQHEKAECLGEYGVHISERFDEEYSYVLYQVNNFYAEVQYNGNDNVIEKIISFSTTTKLEPYLDDIDIDEVTKY